MNGFLGNEIRGKLNITIQIRIYHQTTKSCRYDLAIKTGMAYRTKKLSRALEASALDDGA